MALSKKKLPLRSCRSRTTKLPQSPGAKKNEQFRNRATQELAVDEILVQKAINGGKIPHGAIQLVIDKYHERGFGDCVNRNIINYRLKLRNDNKKMLTNGNNKPNVVPCSTVEILDNQTTISPLSSIDLNNVFDDEDNCSPAIIQNTKNVGGRKKGTTKKQQITNLQNYKNALTVAATRYNAAKNAAKHNLANGTLANIISVVEEELELERGSINRRTIINRVQSQNLDGTSQQKVPPMLEIEEMLVGIIEKLGLMNEPLNRSSIMELCDDIIRNTIHETRLRAFWEKRGIVKVGKQLVGIGWYEGFLKRNQDKLTRKRVQIRDRKRRTWCTVQHFTNMYNTVYDAMVQCGVAEMTENELMYDKYGKVTDDVAMMCGRPTKYRLLKPERCLFVDETGCNTNQKDDGYNGGEMFVVSVDQQETGRNGSVTDIHFTVLPFISGTGEAVLCAIVLKSEKDIKDIPIKWKYGIDITKDVIENECDIKMLELNSGEGKAMSGGPVCRFNGKNLPCFVCTTPKSSITTELLIKMLEYMDNTNIFPRTNENDKPFLLLDGHQSRTKLEFLEYINNKDHAWCCCLGVPYGTHIWQPADSSELNGSFKIAFSKAKVKYQKYKQRNNNSFKPTDIIPLVNMAWGTTLGNNQSARKAIFERGWGILNYRLLDDPRLMSIDDEQNVNHYDSSSCYSRSTKEYQSVLTTINKDGNMFNSCVDALIEEQKKSEGRQRVFLEMLAQQKDQKRKIDRLEDVTNITSAKLAVNNCYVLDDDLLQKFRKVHETKKEEAEKKAYKKIKSNDNDDKKFQTAAEKFRNKLTLNCVDMRALLKRIPPLPSDSPLKNRVSDLSTQMQHRMDRVNIFLDPLYNVANVSNSQIMNFEEDQRGLNILADVLFCDTTSSTNVTTSITDNGTNRACNSNTSNTISNTITSTVGTHDECSV